MSEKFVLNPKTIILNLSHNNINHAYQYSYNNGVWSIDGMLDSSKVNLIPTNSDEYITPDVKYNIVNGKIEGDINNCQKDADFPMYDFDLDMFLIYRIQNSTMGHGFKNDICGLDPVSSDVWPHYYIENSEIPNTDAKINYGYAGENSNINNSSHGTGSALIYNSDNNGTFTLSAVDYTRPYMINPYLLYNNQSENTISNQISLAYNVYMNWDKYINDIANDSELQSKYGFNYSNGVLTLSSDTEKSNCIKNLFGINTIQGENELRFCVIYNTIITSDHDQQKTIVFTNLSSNSMLNNWEYDALYDHPEYNPSNFDKVIEIFTGSNNICVKDTDEVNNSYYWGFNQSVAEYFNYLSNYSYNGEEWEEDYTNIYGGYANARNLKVSSNVPTNYQSWKYICSLEDVPRTGIMSNIYPTYVNIISKFAIIAEQKNIDGNIKYLVKTFDKELNIHFDKTFVNKDILNNKYYQTFVDLPIAFYKNSTDNNLTFPTGIYNSVVKSTQDKHYAGTVYNLFDLMCLDSQDPITGEDIYNHIYYNIKLQNQIEKAECNNLIQPPLHNLEWYSVNKVDFCDDINL